MPVSYEPVTQVSVTRQIAEQIRQSILDGHLKADDRLPTEHELAEQFEVSRPTIREALKRLAAQNLIHSRRGPSGGTFVKRPTEEEARASLATAATLMVSLGEFDLEQIIEARRELEIMCARLAAERCSDEHLKIMADELSHQRKRSLSDEDFCASDVRFHRALVDATGNAMLQFLMVAVIEALQPVENMIIYRYRDRGLIIEQHQAILTALENRDASASEIAVAGQMAYLRKQFDLAKSERQSNKS